jgi:hypothetical protein
MEDTVTDTVIKVEVRKRVEKMERSPRKQVVGRGD